MMSTPATVIQRSSDLSRLVREARLQQGITQQTLSAGAGIAGPALSNIELAKAFVDFSLRAEASAGWAESFRYSPTNRNAKLSPEAAAGVIGSEEAARTLVSFDPIAIGKSRSAWTDEWNRAIAK